MADPQEATKILADKLKSDPQARAKFIDGMKNLLQSNGLDTSDPALLDHFGLTNEKLSGASPEAALSTYIVTIVV